MLFFGYVKKMEDEDTASGKYWSVVIFLTKKKDFRVRVAGAYCELLLVIFSPRILS